MQAIFDQACALPWEQRDDYLDRSCGDDPEMRGEIQEMLAAIDSDNHFLKDPTVHPQAAHAMLEDIKEGMMIGPYKLLEKVGEGASANVYMVEQVEPVRRRLALKIVKLGMDTAEVIARFDAEKQALAMMSHPNIARVFDAGSTPSGRPYFVLELVKGIPITEYCDRNQLTPTARLELFLPVCRALQHAHLKGVIHRDIKPSNILVTLHDGVPVPKVIDFGIAKATETPLTDKTLFTKFHQFVGTPAYMSPEQAEMSGLDVDTRSDVYSLGVLVYELLAGSTPFKSKELLASGYDRIREIIREEEPPLPSTRLSSLGQDGLSVIAKHRRLAPGALNHQVRGELDWIVMKALHKDRTRRYQSASDLAADIRRYLDDEPVEAGPPNKLYVLRKFVRRHRAPVAAASVILLSLVVGIVVATAGWRQAKKEASTAQRESVRADTVAQLLESMFASVDPEANKGSAFTVMQLLEDFKREKLDSLASQPEVEASVTDILAQAYEGLGEYLEAEKHWRRTAVLAARQFGEQSPEAEAARVRLAWVIHAMGHGNEAKAMLEGSLARMEAMLGKDDLRCLEARSFLVGILRDEAELKASERLARETLEAYRLHNAESLPRRLWLLRMLAGIRREQGDLVEAEELAKLAVSSFENDLGAGNPQTLKAYHTLCQTYLAQGQLEEGQSIAEEGLAKARAALGESHVTTLILQRDVAMFQQEKGNHAEARKTLNRVLERQRMDLGNDHPDTLQTQLLLVENYRGVQQSEKAEDLAKEVLTVSREVMGRENAITLESIRSYIQVLFDQERYEEAEPLVKATLETAEKRFGSSHPATLGLRIQLGDIWFQQKDSIAARTLYGAVLEHQLSDLGPDAPACLETQFRMARCLYDERRLLESLRLHREVLSKRRNVLGDRHPATLESVGKVGECLLRRASHERAAPLLREAWTEGKKLDQNSPIDVHRWGKFLGESFERSQLFHEAESVFAEVLESAKRDLGEDHELTHKIYVHWSNAVQNVALAEEKLESQEAKFRKLTSPEAKPPSDAKLLKGLYDLALAQADGAEFVEAEKTIERFGQTADERRPGDVQTALERQFLRARLDKKQGRHARAFEGALEVLRSAMTHQLRRGFVRHVTAWTCFYADHVESFSDVEALLDAEEDRRVLAEWDPQATRTLIPRDAMWKFLFIRTDDPLDWHLEDFPDEKWNRGLAPLGFGIQQLGTLANSITPGRFKPTTYYFRHQFELDSVFGIDQLKIRLRRDDAAIVYINGKEVLRDNLPEETSPSTRALSQARDPEEFTSYVFVIDSACLHEGVNTVAVEVHQHEKITRDLVFQLGMEALIAGPSAAN